MSDTITQLIEYFTKFPGVGKRQAKRFTYFLLGSDASFRKEFVNLISDISKEVVTCAQCKRFFIGKETQGDLCSICTDSARDSQILMVVEKDTDLETIEEAGVFKGTYFILGGLLPIFDGEQDTSGLNTEALTKRTKDTKLKEIIIALAATPEGERTTEYLFDVLKDFKGSISILGRGLSTGVELEYSDSDTIKNALESRRART